MGKILKRGAIILLVFFVVLIAAAVITAALFEDQIGSRIIAGLNDQLETELTVESVDMTVLSTFPDVAANLRGVLLRDTREGVLLEADRLAFNFGLLSFISSEYQVRSVVLEDGAVSIRYDRRGRPNFRVFKQSEAPAEAPRESDLAVSLESATLKNIEWIYVDEQARQEVMGRVEEAVFSGRFSDRAFDLSSEAKLQSGFAEIGGIRYLVGAPIAYEAEAAVDFDAGTYDFRELALSIGDNTFEVKGRIEESEAGSTVNLTVVNDNGDLGGVLQLLPEPYRQSLGDFSSDGDFSFAAVIQGLANKRSSPAIKADLRLEDGRIRSPRLTEDFKDVSFTATFTNGEGRNRRTSVFQVDDLKGYFNRELVELRLRLENLDDPSIDFLLDGVVPLSAVYQFLAEELGDSRINAGFGEIEIDQLRLNGRYKDMISPGRISRVAAVGELTMDDAGIRIGDERLIIDRGVLALQGNALSIRDLKLEGGNSELVFSGTAFNVLPVLFADSLNTQRAELEFSAELVAEMLDIDALLNLSPYSVEEGATPAAVADSLKTRQIENRERLTSYLKGAFRARVAEFNYERIEGRDFSGELKFDNNQLEIQGNAKAMEGSFGLDGRLFFEQQPRLEARLICRDIDVETFFRQSNNFGQTVLTSKNVAGRLNAKMVIYAYWDKQGAFLADKLRVLAGIGVNDGRLSGFGLLDGFSTFVKIQDLKDIRFTNMENFLEVRNQSLYIPVMFLQSNALNLALSGEHNFDNEFRYNLKVNAGQVLAERLKRHDPGLVPKPARRKGFFNLHYTVVGDLDDYEVKSAKRLVKSEFERSEQRKRQILRALRSNFEAMDLIDEPEAWKDIDAPASAGDTADEDPEFLDFEIEGKSSGLHF